MQVHLVLPGLIVPARALPDLVFDLDSPALSWLLGRARRDWRPPVTLESWLTRGFGIADPPPAAALRLLGEGGTPGTAPWLCADPAHLAFEHGRPVLGDPHRLTLAAAEIDELHGALAPLLAELGEFRLAASGHGAGHGYVRLAAPLDIDAVPLGAAVGRGAETLLPRGADARRLVRLANEVQVLLHTLPLNRRREAVGLPIVNTLWFWGAGALPPPAALPASAGPPYAAIAGDGVARGLAVWAGLSTPPLPDTGALADGQATLIVDAALQFPAQQLDAEAWRAAIQELERRWLAPLAGRLRAGALRRLTVTGLGEEGTLQLAARRADALRFWRRPRPLADLAAPEAGR